LIHILTYQIEILTLSYLHKVVLQIGFSETIFRQSIAQWKRRGLWKSFRANACDYETKAV